MPRPKGERKNWDIKRMAEAIAAVREGRMGYLKAAKEFGVPRTTLFRLSKKNGQTNQVCHTKLGRKSALPFHIEEELAKYSLDMDNRFFGLTRSDVRRMAYQLAVSNKIEHSFSTHLQTAGKKWLKGFLKRHPHLTVRKPTGTSAARALGFSRDSVNHFFDILEVAMDKHNYPADRVFNVDETGLTVVQSKCSEVISLKGKRQVGSITSAERGSLITAILCMSAGGTFIPPMLIYPRKNMSTQLEKGAPTGSIFACHPSKWIQTALFTKWFEHFISKVKPSKDDPVLLILDGHNTHTRNIELLKLAKEHSVTIVCLPPHSTHKLQPLDKTIMGALKLHYNEEIRVFLRTNKRAVTQFDIAELFGRAYLKIQCGSNAVKGFEATGLYPVRRNIFQESDFLASTQENDEDQAENVSENRSSNNCPGEESPIIIPQDIEPISTLRKKTGTRGRRPGKANIITSSPYLKELESSLNYSKEKQKTATRNILSAAKNKQKESIESNRPSTSGTVTSKQRKRKVSTSSEDDELLTLQDSSEAESFCEKGIQNPEEDAVCMFCEFRFSEGRAGEVWILCVLCNKWAHEACSGADGNVFVCDFCK